MRTDQESVSEEGRPADAGTARGARALRGAGGAVVLLAVFGIQGLLPGQIGGNPDFYAATGLIECFAEGGLGTILEGCHRMGEPLGLPMLSRVPVVALGTLYVWLPLVGAHAATQLSLAAWTALGFLGGYAVLRRLGATAIPALLGSGAYLASPSLIGLRGFGGTYSGFSLLPAYLYADMLLMSRFARPRKHLPLWLLGYVVLRLGALFMDGYSFVASAVVSGIVVLAWAERPRPAPLRRVAALGFVGAANLLAVVVYRGYVPGGLYEPSSIDQFRAMGADLATVFAPTTNTWWAAKLGVGRGIESFWGDGSNALYNYAGYVCIVLALAYLAARWRRPWVVPLAVAAAVTFVLALGPSLKVDDQRSAVRDHVSMDWYLMPRQEATMQLPTARLFELVPGIDQTRATYRWSTVTRMVLVFFVALSLSELARRRGRSGVVAAVLLAGVAVVEVAPDVPALLRDYSNNPRSVEAFDRTVVHPLDRALPEESRVLYLSAVNDYLANYMSPMARLRSYNVGGDKNNVMSRPAWPENVKQLARTKDVPDSARRAFDGGELDAIVVMGFSLRYDSSGWPPETHTRKVVEQRYADLLADPRFEVERYEWFWVVTPRDPTPASVESPG